MAEQLADRVILRIEQVAGLYHRLVMLVAPSDAGKTVAFQDVRERTAAPDHPEYRRYPIRDFLNCSCGTTRRLQEWEGNSE